jgi:hypothetical protein
MLLVMNFGAAQSLPWQIMAEKKMKDKIQWELISTKGDFGLDQPHTRYWLLRLDL